MIYQPSAPAMPSETFFLAYRLASAARLCRARVPGDSFSASHRRWTSIIGHT
jgi:hypothetical protein